MVEGNDGEQKFSVSLGPELEYPQSFCLLLLPVLFFFFFFSKVELCAKRLTPTVLLSLYEDKNIHLLSCFSFHNQ